MKFAVSVASGLIKTARTKGLRTTALPGQRLLHATRLSKKSISVSKRAAVSVLIVATVTLASCGLVFLQTGGPFPNQVHQPPVDRLEARSGKATRAGPVKLPTATTTPTVVATPAAGAQANPRAAPTAVPTASVEQFWLRMRALQWMPVLDRLSILPPAERDDPLFGINDSLAEENGIAPLFQGIGASIDRVEVHWDQVEPAPGDFRFDRLDRLFTLAAQWHLNVVVVVDGTPAWAVAGSDRAGAGLPRGLGAPALLPDGSVNTDNPWAFFLSRLADRYGKRVTAWEIWNEPNLPTYWSGSVADYARLLEVAGAVLRHEAPGTRILTAGLVEDDGTYLNSVMQVLCPRGTCATPPFDGVAWHVYNNPEDILKVAARTRAILARYQLHPPIWITEANVPVDDPSAPADAVVQPGAASLDEQAAFVVQAYALARAADVQTVAIYRASDEDEAGHYWGLIRGDRTGRPTLFAYRTAAEWLSHTTFVRLSHPLPTVTRVQLRRPGEQISVLWSESSAPTNVRIPARATRGLLVQQTGASEPIQAVGGAFLIRLPPAPPRTPPMPVLASPVLLVLPGADSPTPALR